MSFKILAVRILDGCESHIKKCLKEGETYYLHNGYIISNDGEYVVKNTKCRYTLSDDFYSIDDVGINVNISAIVGKNGEGKSALIEIIIRLINNIACNKKFCEDNNLVKINLENYNESFLSKQRLLTLFIQSTI